MAGCTSMKNKSHYFENKVSLHLQKKFTHFLGLTLIFTVAYFFEWPFNLQFSSENLETAPGPLESHQGDQAEKYHPIIKA